MSSTYSTSLRIELQATGANSGTWGTITNNNFSQSLEFSIAGVVDVACGDNAVTTLACRCDVYISRCYRCSY